MREGICLCVLTDKVKCKIKGKAVPVQACYTPIGFQDDDAPSYLDNRHRMVVRLLAVRPASLHSRNIPCTDFC
jgi:hypothetical protein